jgi:hypothetical protein
MKNLLAGIVVLLSSFSFGHSADPGAAMYNYLHTHGATMPTSWIRVVDERHASACVEYAKHYTDYPAGYVDEFGVNAALATAAVNATGFCS